MTTTTLQQNYGARYAIRWLPQGWTITAGHSYAVTVTVTLPYSKVSLTHFPLLPVPTEIKGRVSMAKEGPSS